MRDDTAAWLDPLFEELTKRNDGDIDVQRLMMAATMPAAEAGTQMMDWLVRNVPDGVSAGAIDWIRFGNLLAEALGWPDYPGEPS